jgi:hypothetical protein
MSKGRSQFIGTAGQFYLAYGLAVRDINASVTIGNAPSVDVLASSEDGRRSLSFQVKTSRNAYRKNRYGKEGFEWDVGPSVIGKYRESFWYAFIDLQEQNHKWNPRVFFVPSRWVAEFVKADWTRYMYFLPSTAQELTLERWDLVRSYLAGDKKGIKWANDWPKEILVEWGQD